MALEVELAWAAGIIDGEGCIFIKRQAAETRKDLKSDAYSLGIKVVMNHEPTVRRLFAIFPLGNMYPLKQRGFNQSWQWVVMGSQCREILLAIKPFCITKANEIDCALAFIALPKWGGGHHRGPRSPGLTQQRYDLWREMRDLKPRSLITIANREARRGI